MKNSLGVEIPEGMFTPHKKTIFQLTAIIAIGLTVWVWYGIIGTQVAEDSLYILNVGQGDSQLIILASENGRSSIKILMDGGKDKTVLNALDDALGRLNDKYIDIIILTHTDLDHMGGLIEVLKRYEVGMFISNGREAVSEAYSALKETLASRNIPTAILLEGDVIRYAANSLVILSPDSELLENKNVNEAGLVISLKTDSKNVLFTGDIGLSAENLLLKKDVDISADVLKVGHHGSKNSSSENFIAAVRPTVSVIGVGKNSYGHPAKQVLETLELAGSRIYRTDINGTIKIHLNTQVEPQNAKAQSSGSLAALASVITGKYKDTKITNVYLRQLQKDALEFSLVPYKKCSFYTDSAPRHTPVIINEVAWMGSPTGTTHEWIELRNVSTTNVNMSGWQLLNENEKIRVIFPQKLILNEPYMLLARSAANDALGLDAKIAFTGAIRNSNEGLRLFDNECNVIDEIRVSSKWIAGNNSSKQTMERANDLSWRTSIEIGGTPDKENVAPR